MSYRKNYTQIGHQDIGYITEITGNSLPLALCLSLLEVTARFYSTKRQIINPVINSINQLIQQSLAQYPQGKDYLENFKIVLDRICNLESPFKSLEYIDSVAMNQSEPEPRAIIFYLDIASRCLMATLLSQKLNESGRLADLDSFFKNNDMRAIDSMILLKFTNHFNIDIQLYESTTKSSICNTKQGCFPLIHLFKQDYRYSLAYPSEFVEIRSKLEFDLRALESLPFYINRKSSGPIRDPIQAKEQEPSSDSKNDSENAMFIESIFKKMTSKNIFTTEFIEIVTSSLDNNGIVKNNPWVAQYLTSATMSLRSCGEMRTCIICRNPIENSIATSHYECGVCNNCMVDQRFNARCPKCRDPFNPEDKRKLRLP